MRYNTVINNIKAYEWGLNIQQAYLFAWFYELPSWADKMILNNKVYYFASKTKAIQELPLLTDKLDTMYRFYKQIESLGLIEIKKIDNKDYIFLTEKAKLWNGLESEHSEKNPNELGNKSENNSEINPTYNIYNINNKISDNNNSVYGQNKNFATPANQLDLEIEANKIEAEQLALNNQKEKKEKSCAKKESRFSKPNIDEIKDYFFEIGCENYNLESEKFFDYYESNGWQVGKSKMKDWKATARNWNRNTKKFNNGQQTNNTNTATGNAYEWKPNLQEQLESAAEHLRKINSF